MKGIRAGRAVCLLPLIALSACVTARHAPSAARPTAPAEERKPAASAKSAAPSPEAISAWSRAVYAFEKGDYEDAAKNASQAIDAGMDGIEVRILHAESLAYGGHLADAERALTFVTRNFTAPPSAYFLLGKIYLIWGHGQKAEEAISKAFSRGGTDDEALYQLGDLQLRQRVIPKAIDSFKSYVDRHPEDPEGLTRYAVALLDGGRGAEAEEVLHRLLTVDPESRLALFTLALLAEQREERQKASAYYDRLLEIEPDNSEVIAQRANLAEMQKETDTAVKLRRRILELSPKNLQNRYRLGQVLIDAARDTEAYQVFLDMSRDIPELGQPYVQMGYIEIRRGRHLEAVELLDEAAERMPDNAEVPTMIGFTYLAVRNDTRAAEAFQRALRLDPKNVDILFALAEVESRLGRFNACVRVLQQILNIQPDHAAALNFLGYVYAERGIRLADAERMVKRALKAEPSNAYYLDSMGWIYFKKGKMRMALEYLDRAAGLLADAVIFEHLGDVYAALGSTREARESYERSLEKNQTRTVEDKLRLLAEPSSP